MRQVILVPGSVAFATSGAITTSNKFGFAKQSADGPVFTNTAADVRKECSIAVNAGGKITDLIPFIGKAFSYSKSTVETLATDTKADADFSDVEFTQGYDYTIIFVKKGVQFNERNKWTFTYRADETTTAAKFAQAVADFLAAQTGLELGATVDGEVVTFATTSADKTLGFKIIFTDALIGVTDGAETPVTIKDIELQPTLVSSSKLQVADVKKYLKDLYMKACADRGYEYTYDDDINFGLKGDGVDMSAYTNGATIYTLFFAEPRAVKTVDEAIKQIVQIVLPKEVSSAYSALDILLAAI